MGKKKKKWGFVFTNHQKGTSNTRRVDCRIFQQGSGWVTDKLETSPNYCLE